MPNSSILPITGHRVWPQQRLFPSASTRVGARVEIPTLAVAFAIYSGFAALTWFFRDLPLWMTAPLCAMCLTWFGSLQHETIHGHPTPWRRLNESLGSVPLSLWIPYRLYRATHLQHHRHGGRRLTDTIDDPESFYLRPGTLAQVGSLRRWVYVAHCTLAGRLILGPALSMLRFWSSEARALLDGDRRRRSIWTHHAAAAAAVLLWTTWVCHIPITVYVLLIVYPSASLTQLRSFVEHRSHPDPSLRTRTVECHAFWALLFLNNNLHIAHHAYPKLPWYELPSVWRHMRGRAVMAGAVFLGGYRQVTGNYWRRPVIAVEHPDSPTTGLLLRRCWSAPPEFRRFAGNG